MKIYIDLAKQVITKTESDTLYQGDVGSNEFNILFFNYADTTNWYPTMSQLAPNGRAAGDFEADALGSGETHNYTEHGVTYQKYTFTMNDTWVKAKGRNQFYIWLNTIKPMTRKCIGQVNVTINESTDGYFVFNPYLNPSVATFMRELMEGVAHPAGVYTNEEIADLQEDIGIVVSSTDGYWYYWDVATNEYVQGAIYQAPVYNSSNKLNADLVDDTNSTHKFVTAEQRTQIGTNATNITALQNDKADKNNSSQAIVAGTVGANTLKANTKVISPRIQSNTNDNFYEQIGMYQGSDNSFYKRFIVQRKDYTWLPDVSQPVYFPFFQLSDDTYHNNGKDNVTGLGLGLRTTNGVKPDFQIIPAFRFSSDWQNFAHDKLEPVYLFRPNLALLPNGQIVTVDNPGVYMQLNSYGEIIIESHGLETSEYSSLNIAQDGISFYLRNEEDGLKETSVTINIDSFHYEQNNINSTTPIPFFDFENGKFTVTNAHFYEGNKQVATQEYVNGEITTLDNDLQSQIDGINAGQNLADIVTDLTALNNLPTSNLEVDDKVQVLVDSNHDNASTVYRWTGSAWSYIGKYGQDSYTKAEVNTLLDAKQDVIDASHKLNADLVDDTNATNKFVTASEKAQITTNANNISSLRTGSDLTNTLEFTKTVNQSWDYIIQNGLSSTPLISQADFNKLNQNTVIIYNVISSVDNVQFKFYLRCESAIVNQSDMTLNYKGTYGLETGDGMFTMEFSANNSLSCDMHLTYTQTYTREDVDTAINNSFLTDAQMTTLLSEVFD